MKTWYFGLIAAIAVIAFFIIPPVVLAQVPPPMLPQDQGSVMQSMLNTETKILAELKSVNANLEKMQEEESNFIIALRVKDARLSCDSETSIDLKHSVQHHNYNDHFLVWHDGQDIATGHIDHGHSLGSGTPYVVYDLQLNANSTAFTGKGIVFEDNSRPTCGATTLFPVTISGSCDGSSFSMTSDYPGGYNVTANQALVLCHVIEE